MVKIIADPLVLSDYPNVLADPRPKRFAFPRRWFVLMGLVLLCFVPRAMIVTKCSSVCPDATLYIKVAKSIDKGQWHPDTFPLQIAAYPAIISGLHRVGFDWEVGTRWWGVVISSLAVLPLFGWIRRQFDDRVALAACFLYAVHQRLIEWSPSIIRDPTFWFLFVLSLYLFWRAVCEVRVGLFVAAGIAATLSATMRVEGIFLLVPFAIWTMCRWWALREAGWRLAVGAALGFLACPAIMLLLITAFLHGQSAKQVSQLPEILPVQKWRASIGFSLENLTNRETPPSSSAAPLRAQQPPPIGPDRISRMSAGKMLWEYARALETGFTAVYVLLMLGGIWRWRRVWARRDNQPLFFIALIIMVGIWLDFSHGQRTSQRYPLTIVLMSLPFAALALLGVSQWLRDVACRRGLNVRWQMFALFAPAILVVLINFSEISSRRYQIWESYAKIGLWMRAELGKPPNIAGHEAVARVANYYSDGSYISIPRMWGPAVIARIAQNKKLNYFLLSKREMRYYDATGLLAEMKKLGFREVDPDRLPAGTHRIMVFERKKSGNTCKELAHTPNLNEPTSQTKSRKKTNSTLLINNNCNHASETAFFHKARFTGLFPLRHMPWAVSPEFSIRFLPESTPYFNTIAFNSR